MSFKPSVTYSVLAVLADARFVSTSVSACDGSTLLVQLEQLARDWQKDSLYTLHGRTPVVRLFAGREGSVMFEFDVDARGVLTMSTHETLDDACPGCGCKPGDGRTRGCSHPEGCGF